MQVLDRDYLPSKLYGMSHLLRMLVILPELVASAAPITPDQHSLLQDALKHFVHWLLVQLVSEHRPAGHEGS